MVDYHKLAKLLQRAADRVQYGVEWYRIRKCYNIVVLKMLEQQETRPPD